MAVKQVGVVAVWAFRLTHTDSYSTHRLNAYSKPLLTLWISGIDFRILKLNELWGGMGGGGGDKEILLI